MKIINKDITTVENGIILHGCNAQIAMKSGVALALRNKYPIIYDKYKELCLSFSNDFQRLGQCSVVEINKNLTIINIISQLFYGYGGERYSDYSAINQAFSNIRDSFPSPDTIFYLPYKIFSDRGGADWNIVSKMIDFYFPDAIVCSLDERSNSI